MRLPIRLLTATGLACALSYALAGTAPTGPLSPVELSAPTADSGNSRAGPVTSTTRGGTLRLRFNNDLLREYGLGEATGSRISTNSLDAGLSVDLSSTTAFSINGTGPDIRAISSGSGRLGGGIRLSGGRVDLDFEGMRFVVRPGAAPRIDLIAADGRVLFYVDKIMYQWQNGGQQFVVHTADMNISAELAGQLGYPHAADAPIADFNLVAPVTASRGLAEPKGSSPHFHGQAVAGVPGATWQADVFMQTFNMQYGGCNGCAGADGEVKFTPNSTLINNRNNGTAVVTVSGDPLGTSAALYTAEIPWYRKFNVSPYPYPYPGNDQHPYLIWNIYRIGADGGIVQIGRSGVKHAFVSTNSGAECDDGFGGNILGRACSDTYSTGNNDNPGDLGPRSEIVPATGQWGRCFSIFDTNCDASPNSVSSGAYDRRLLVRESEIDPALNAGASWLSESWYIIQDDINVYNTMASRPFSSTATGGGGWTSVNGSPYRLGPAVDRWFETAAPAAQKQLSTLESSEGRARLASKAISLGNGLVRYHYALMNIDFARAVIDPANANPPNLNVLRNLGFDSLDIPVGEAVSDIRFADGDDSAANDWTAQQVGGRVIWTAPAGNELNWGTLYSFSFVAQSFGRPALATVGIAEAGTPASNGLSAIIPSSGALLSDSFE